MKKRILITILIALSFFCNALTKIKYDNGISLSFEGCTDGSIRFEIKNKKPYAPMKELELKRVPSKNQFKVDENGNYCWENYKIEITEDGYNLFADDRLLYKASFSEEKTQLKEKRVWETATGFYGFGEASTTLNLSDQSLTIFNESKYGNHAFLFIPFYFTNENTSVYYNANGKDKIYFQNGKDYQLYRTEYGRIESFVRQYNSPEECVRLFYEETEVSCLLPKWSYGYIQSKYGYKSCEEVLELTDNFKKHEIPLSAVVLDLYWFKRMGDIFWTSSDFSSYKDMNEKMESDGIKLITITEPFYTTECENYSELKSKGLLCKNKNGKIALWRDWWCLDDFEGGVINPFSKSTKKFLGEKYSKMIDSGIDGFWTDLGEPEGAWNQKNLKLGKYMEQDAHNYFNLYWSKGIYEGVAEHYPNKRLFMMSRSGFTGIGKYNVSVWSGDAKVSWPSLEKQMIYGMNAGLCGLPYWGSDVGGFTPEHSPEELYVRWHQFGAFTPIYRAHGTAEREPYAYSPKAEKIVKGLIDTRIKLLPYIYSTARQTMNGLPMMRPLFFVEKNAPAEYCEKEFMFGDSILVAPITGESSYYLEHNVYLPEGRWYDFYTMKQMEGGTYKYKNDSLEFNPVYIKEGAIIPCEQNGVSYIFIIPSENKESTFTLYNDDGETNEYKSGNCSELKIMLKEMKIYCETSQNTKYLSNEYTLALPSSIKTTEEWKIINNCKVKTVTIDELIAGIDL